MGSSCYFKQIVNSVTITHSKLDFASHLVHEGPICVIKRMDSAHAIIFATYQKTMRLAVQHECTMDIVRTCTQYMCEHTF